MFAVSAAGVGVMSKHTPGPWRVIQSGMHWNNPGQINWNIAWSDDGELVTELVYEEADARLIAAAPELLEACKAAADNGLDLPNLVVYELEAAIAKATGNE